MGARERKADPRPGGPRVALYSHDTMGIGHMRRNLRMARAFAAHPSSANVLLIAGAREAGAFPMPPGVDCLTLPSLHKAADGNYQPRAWGVPLAEFVGLRARAIASALAAFSPDVLVVDKEPRGALRELEPALEALREQGRARCVLGLRDVLDGPATVRREWGAAANEAAVRDYYDAVWVYGDPAVYDPVAEYGLGPAVSAKVSYTGYLAPRPAESANALPAAGPELPPGPFALCMVGGGQDGARLAEAFAVAERPAGLAGVVVTGPFMPPEARERLLRRAGAGLRVLEFVADPCRLIARAERIVAMGGYNTVCELLAYEKPALLVPRVTPRREQLIRAERLRELGLLDLLTPDAVSPAALSRWLAGPPAATRPRARDLIDLDGAARLPGLLRSVLAPPAARTSKGGARRVAT